MNRQHSKFHADQKRLTFQEVQDRLTRLMEIIDKNPPAQCLKGQAASNLCKRVLDRSGLSGLGGFFIAAMRDDPKRCCPMQSHPDHAQYWCLFGIWAGGPCAGRAPNVAVCAFGDEERAVAARDLLERARMAAHG